MRPLLPGKASVRVMKSLSLTSPPSSPQETHLGCWHRSLPSTWFPLWLCQSFPGTTGSSALTQHGAASPGTRCTLFIWGLPCSSPGQEIHTRTHMSCTCVHTHTQLSPQPSNQGPAAPGITRSIRNCRGWHFHWKARGCRWKCSPAGLVTEPPGSSDSGVLSPYPSLAAEPGREAMSGTEGKLPTSPAFRLQALDK